jgi:DNA-binding PadR family transcriptional regulator
MSLPHALLGLISYQPSTGYELRTTFTESVQFFWSATLPQIYRTLSQMESQGWLTAKVEPQEGKPSRKVYSITDEGVRELKQWLESQPVMPPERNPFLLKIFFGRMANTDILKKTIAGWREHHANLLERSETETISAKDMQRWPLSGVITYSKLSIKIVNHYLKKNKRHQKYKEVHNMEHQEAYEKAKKRVEAKMGFYIHLLCT